MKKSQPKLLSFFYDKLSGADNFTLAELVASQVARESDIENVPDVQQIENLRLLAREFLQPTRDHWGKINITSGYRSRALNDVLRGANKRSYHLNGEAVDFVVSGKRLQDVYDWIVKHMRFTECFLERNASGKQWIHVAYSVTSLNQEFAVDNLVGDGEGVA